MCLLSSLQLTESRWCLSNEGEIRWTLALSAQDVYCKLGLTVTDKDGRDSRWEPKVMHSEYLLESLQKCHQKHKDIEGCCKCDCS